MTATTAPATAKRFIVHFLSRVLLFGRLGREFLEQILDRIADVLRAPRLGVVPLELRLRDAAPDDFVCDTRRDVEDERALREYAQGARRRCEVGESPLGNGAQELSHLLRRR